MSSKEQIKHTGATFTPKLLSEFLADKLISYMSHTHQNILDPACGEGELLLAMGHKLSANGLIFTLSGYDANSEYLLSAKERLLKSGINKPLLIHGNFLDAIMLNADQGKLQLFQNENPNINGRYDVVIANPPYVRTQILGMQLSQMLAKKFNLKGRVDLYYPFLIAMTESLKEGGLLGVITSNRYLTTRSGESIRKFLSENYEILELIDLGDTKLFEAAVLPAIFIGRKIKPKISSPAQFIKLYEELNGYSGDYISVSSVYDILRSQKSGYFSTNQKRYKKSSGILNYSIGSTSSWKMLSNNESEWVSIIERTSKYRVSDFFKVKVGIKSTADKIFIRDDWDNFGEDKPEDDLLKELISQENIGPWHASPNNKLKVLYPHIHSNGENLSIDLKNYPNTLKYLLFYEEKLRSRKYLIEAGRKWYELWVPHRPDQWKYPKLVFPDISVKPRFYFDEGGKIVNGNCYWIVAIKNEDVDKLLLIQGLANSKLMTKYHDLVFNNKLYSGRRRYFTQFVEKYPLPEINSLASKEVISLVRKLNNSVDSKEIAESEHLLEIKVAECFSVDPIFNLD